MVISQLLKKKSYCLFLCVSLQAWSIIFYALILLSAATVAMETHPSFRVPHPNSDNVNHSNPKIVLLRTTIPHPAVDYANDVCVCIFTLELFLRMMTCPSKLQFIKSVYNIIDVVCVIPLLIVFILGLVWRNMWHKGQLIRVVGYLSMTSVLHVFRLFKVARHYKCLRILHLAMRSSLRELMLLIILIFQGILVFSTLIYFAEFYEEDNFSNIPIGLWWSIITMTTVGYGDQAPKSVWGYLVGSACAVSGILITGLAIPIIASNFNHYHEYAKLASKLSTKKRRKIWPVWSGRMLGCGDSSRVSPMVSPRVSPRASHRVSPAVDVVESHGSSTQPHQHQHQLQNQHHQHQHHQHHHHQHQHQHLHHHHQNILTERSDNNLQQTASKSTTLISPRGIALPKNKINPVVDDDTRMDLSTV